MKEEVVIATRNEKKLREIKRLFRGSGINILSLKAFPGAPRVIEDGRTFKDNAAKKALVVSRHTKKLTLADDSGLEVAALKGSPGVRSSRFAGPRKSDRLNNLRLLEELKKRPLKKRSARFRCVVALACCGKLIKLVEGKCSGRIGFNIEGSSGFGYDPLFIPRGYRKSFAKLGPGIKDRLSHRSKALKKAKGFIEAYLLRGL